MKKVVLAFILILIVSIGIFLFFFFDEANAPADESAQAQTVATQNNASADNNGEFNKTQYSLENPESIWIVVNKKRPIPTTYIPSDLTVPNVSLRLADTEEQMHIRQAAAGSLKEMFDKAKNSGVDLVFGSGYRSASLQKTFYDQYVSVNGQQAADTFSARPGYSEHQTGLSFDVTSISENCHLEICFADTPEGKWVAKNAYKHGFIIRYPDGKDLITGYQYEPWHLRYVGTELAEQIKKSGKTLEQFFDLDNAPTY